MLINIFPWKCQEQLVVVVVLRYGSNGGSSSSNSSSSRCSSNNITKYLVDGVGKPDRGNGHISIFVDNAY